MRSGPLAIDAADGSSDINRILVKSTGGSLEFIAASAQCRTCCRRGKHNMFTEQLVERNPKVATRLDFMCLRRYCQLNRGGGQCEGEPNSSSARKGTSIHERSPSLFNIATANRLKLIRGTDWKTELDAVLPTAAITAA
jgi:hypothetical protein